MIELLQWITGARIGIDGRILASGHNFKGQLFVQQSKDVTSELGCHHANVLLLSQIWSVLAKNNSSYCNTACIDGPKSMLVLKESFMELLLRFLIYCMVFAIWKLHYIRMLFLCLVVRSRRGAICRCFPKFRIVKVPSQFSFILKSLKDVYTYSCLTVLVILYHPLSLISKSFPCECICADS